MVEEPAGLVLAKKVASWGFRVIPAFVTRDGDKIPLAGKGWAAKATTSEVQLEKWWGERGWARVGIVSGLDSSWVLDIDGPEAVAWWREFVLRHGGWEAGGLTYRTPGKNGGLHWMLRPPRRVASGGWYSGADICQATVHLPGGGEVQLRGRDHWTLLIGPDRKEGSYELIEEPGDDGPIEAPERLLRPFLAEASVFISTATGGGGGGGGLQELTVEDAFDGRMFTDGRKNAVAGLAWAMSLRGSDYAEVLATCERFAEECCQPALELDVVRRKVDYTWNRIERLKEKEEAENAKLMAMMTRQLGIST